MTFELSTLGSVIKTAYEAEADTNAFTDAEKSKLAGVDALADVTDTANVEAAGALMDSEVTNLADVKAFDPTDYATAAQGATADLVSTRYVGQNLQTGTTYELVLTDAGKVVDLSNASPIALTIPANASVAFPVDTRIDIHQSGAGLVTVGITSDTLRGDPVSQGQYKMMSLWKRATTEWVIAGGTTA